MGIGAVEPPRTLQLRLGALGAAAIRLWLRVLDRTRERSTSDVRSG
jgi:hypothetical protein